MAGHFCSISKAYRGMMKRKEAKYRIKDIGNGWVWGANGKPDILAGPEFKKAIMREVKRLKKHAHNH